MLHCETTVDKASAAELCDLADCEASSFALECHLSNSLYTWRTHYMVNSLALMRAVYILGVNVDKSSVVTSWLGWCARQYMLAGACTLA